MSGVRRLIVTRAYKSVNLKQPPLKPRSRSSSHVITRTGRTDMKYLSNTVAGAALLAGLVGSAALSLEAGPALAMPEGGYGDLVAKLSPSVVNIEVTGQMHNA